MNTRSTLPVKIDSPWCRLCHQVSVPPVSWWNSLHQGESIFTPTGPKIAPVFLIPLALMILGYLASFAALWIARTRGEVWRRRAQSLAVQAAQS